MEEFCPSRGRNIPLLGSNRHGEEEKISTMQAFLRSLCILGIFLLGSDADDIRVAFSIPC